MMELNCNFVSNENKYQIYFTQKSFVPKLEVVTNCSGFIIPSQFKPHLII